MQAADLTTALRPAVKVAKGGVDHTAGVRLIGTGDRLHVEATQGDLSVQVQIFADVDLSPVIVPAKELLALIIGLDKDQQVKLSVEGVNLVVVSDNVRVTFPTFSDQYWPKVLHCAGSAHNITDFVGSLQAVLYATDAKHPVRCGVSFRGGWVSATDTQRLAAIEVDADLPEVIVPAGVLEMALEKVDGEVIFYVDDYRATMVTEEATWTTRLISGSFPVWRHLVPERTVHGFMVEAEELTYVLKLYRGVVPGEDVKLEQVTDKQLRVTGGDMTRFEHVLPGLINLTGPVWFSPRQLLDNIAANGEEGYHLFQDNPLKPAVSYANGIQLLMPRNHLI